MSKKNLLNENTVREFMKFANLGALAENFVNETYGEEEVVEEDAVEEGMGHYTEEEEGIEAMGDDIPVDDAPVDIDAPDVADEAPSEELPAEAVDALEHAVEAAADAMLAALAPFGVEGEASVEDAAPVDDAPADLGADDVPADLAADEPAEEEEILDEIDVLDEEAVVNETVGRVMNRLKLMKETKEAEEKKDKMIDSVADAIVARLRAKK